MFYADKADVVVEVLPDGNVHLARAGVVKNEEELLHVMGLRDALKAPKGKKLVVYDLSQVECVSGDGFVLTNNGMKKICEISTSDLVFDGVEYVTHDGVMFKGVKDVIEYCGVVGTPDHIVYTRSGEPITLDQAAFSKAELCTGGAEWDKVWEMGGFKQTNTIDDTDDQSLVSMPMWFGASSCDKRPKNGKSTGCHKCGNAHGKVYADLPEKPRNQLRVKYNALQGRVKANKFTNRTYANVENRFTNCEEFVRYMWSIDPKDDYTGWELDRIDTNGHYEKGNLRFVTRVQNAQTRKCTRSGGR